MLSTDERKPGEADADKIVAKDVDVKKFNELPVEERLRILEQYTGSAKYPDFPTNKYDVYDQ